MGTEQPMVKVMGLEEVTTRRQMRLHNSGAWSRRLKAEED
jgi:hypothetical protein